MRIRCHFGFPTLFSKTKNSAFSLITSSSMSYHKELAAAKKAASLAASLCQAISLSLSPFFDLVMMIYSQSSVLLSLFFFLILNGVNYI